MTGDMPRVRSIYIVPERVDGPYKTQIDDYEVKIITFEFNSLLHQSVLCLMDISFIKIAPKLKRY